MKIQDWLRNNGGNLELLEKQFGIRTIDKEWAGIDNLWYCFHDEPSQKKFALVVKDSPHSGILFSARKLGVDPYELFYNLEYLTKMFKGTKGDR